MKKFISAINLLFSLSLLVAQQQPTYVNWNNFIVNYNDKLIETPWSNEDCKIYQIDPLQIDPIKEFPKNFVFEIRDPSRVFPSTQQGIPNMGIKVFGLTDFNCNSIAESRRSEIMFTKLSNQGIGWYKLRFYIPNDFKIANVPSDNLHNIFQIKTNTTIEGTKVTPLPIFLLEFNHSLSTSTKAVLTLKYGLEFRVAEPYVNCEGCDECANCPLGNNNIADLNHQVGCWTSLRQSKNLSVNYGWNEMLIKVNWENNSNGSLRISFGSDLTTAGGGNISAFHTFYGPNVYHSNMLPLVNGGVLQGGNIPITNKFGHYSYLHGYPEFEGSESTLYFDYFYAVDDTHKSNLDKFTRTYINNDQNGILDFKQNISCDLIHGADEYVYLIRDAQATNNLNDQYIGSQFNGLTISSLLQNADIEFNKDYLVAISTKFNKGFQSPYSPPKTVKFSPTSKLTSTYCNNLNINYNSTLSAETVLEANEYVYYIYDTVTGLGYYSGTGTGQISVATLFAQHNLKYNRLYKISVSPKFDTYGMQGPYGQPCDVKFKNSFSMTETFGAGNDDWKQGVDQMVSQKVDLNQISIYPNPIKNVVNFSEKVKQITVYDLSGKIVKTQKMTLDKLDISSIPTGSYILTGETERGKKFSKEFIKK